MNYNVQCNNAQCTMYNAMYNATPESNKNLKLILLSVIQLSCVAISFLLNSTLESASKLILN